MKDKHTVDNFPVPDRTWYYLLDYNEQDEWKTIYEQFKKNRLLDLTKEEYWKLFEIATKQDKK